MKVKFGWKQTVVFLLAMTIGGVFSGCSGEQNNPPLLSNQVELVNSALVVDTAGKQIDGFITTQYNGAGDASLNAFKVKIPNCVVSSFKIDNNNSIQYHNNIEISSPVTIVLKSACNPKRLELSATEKTDVGSLDWNTTASITAVGDIPPDSNTSDTIASLEFIGKNPSVVIGENSQEGVFRFYALKLDRKYALSGAVSFSLPSHSNIIIQPGTASVSNGVVTFNYAGPSDLQSLAGTDQNYTFCVENSTIPICENVNFQFRPGSSGGGTAPTLSRLYVDTPTLTLSSGSQQFPVNVVAMSSDNTAYNGGTIEVVYPNSVNAGLFDVSEALISNGKATFNFTGPQEINGTLGDQVFVFRYKEDANISTSMVVKYQPDANEQKIDNLTLSETATTITKNGETHIVKVIAKDSSNNFVTNGTINVNWSVVSGEDAGSFSAISVPLVNGVAEFTYTGPADLFAENGRSVQFTFSDATGSAPDKSWNVNFTSSKPTLKVENGNITLTESGENVEIRVLAYDENNQTFNSGTIAVKYPSSIVNGSISGGRFLENEVSISNGIALFNFVGPKPLKQIHSQTFEFMYKEDPTVKTAVAIDYRPNSINVVLRDTNTTITRNSQSLQVNVNVVDSLTNAPVNGGKVYVIYPNEVQDAVDVGYFLTSSVEVVNGVASFNYTAPKNLDELVNGTPSYSQSIFKFYYGDNIVDAVDNVYTMLYDPEPGQIVQTDYTLISSIDDENVSMELNSSRNLTFSVVDESKNVIPDADIVSMKMTLLNREIGTLIKPDGTAANTITEKNKNNITINFKSDIISGVAPIKVDVTFTDVNGDRQNRSEIFSIVVLSGPPTAMSISYVSTEQDKANAKFIDHMVVTVTDKYNNPVNSQPSISVGAIAGYARDTASKVGNKYAVSLTKITNGVSDGVATLSSLSPGASLQATGIASTKIDPSNDKLAIFGIGYTYQASGKWEIVDSNNDKLTLKESYDSIFGKTDKLGYAIGNNHRQEICSDTGDEAVANVIVEDGSYQVDVSGNAKIAISYDYYLVGKTAVVYANTIGEVNTVDVNNNKVSVETRIGESGIHTFRGSGYDFGGSDSVSFTIPKSAPAGTSVTANNIRVKDTGIAMQNGKFVYSVQASKDIVIDQFVGNYGGTLYPAYFNGSNYVVEVNASNAASYQDIPDINVTGRSGDSMDIGTVIDSSQSNGVRLKSGRNGGIGIYNCDNAGAGYIRVYVHDTTGEGGEVTIKLSSGVVAEY